MYKILVNTGSIESKRLYLDAKIDCYCPNCDSPLTRDLGYNYLSYPNLGVREELDFYCGECENEWSKEIMVTVNIDVYD